jgi:alpha-N-arabinofuranosidase
MKHRPPLLLLLLLLGVASRAPAAPVTVDVGRPGAAINPGMWGVFFEDINFGADGGLYAEMVKNRGFEFPAPLMGWTTILPNTSQGDVTVRTETPFSPANPHYARIRARADGPLGLSNEGFRGMGVKQGETYDFSAQVRLVAGRPKLSVRLYGGDGALLDSVDVAPPPGTWGKVAATLRPNDTDPAARLSVLVVGGGTVDVDFVSLFPAHPW